MTIAGTAEQSVDYTSPSVSGVTSLSVPEGESQLSVTLVTLDRTGFQPSRTVTLSLSETADYSVGASGSAEVAITDSDTLATAPGANEVINRRTTETFTGASAIQDAINDADTMNLDVLDVGPGTFNGFQAFKDVTLYGPNAGVDPSATRNPEAVITSTVLVSPTANNREAVELDGFDLETVQTTAAGGSSQVELTVRNSIFNNGLAGGSYISAFNVPETTLTVENNSFSGLTSSASAISCFLENADPTLHDIRITGNLVQGTINDDQRGFQFNNCANVLVEGNTLEDLGRQGIAIAATLGAGGSHRILNNVFTDVNVQGMGQTDQRGAFRLSDTDTLAGPLFFSGNKVTGANGFGGIAISDNGSGGGNFATSNFFFNFNNLTPGNGPGFFNPGPSPTGSIDLTQNWWGTADPMVGTEIQGAAGATGLVIDPTLTAPIE